MKTRSTIPAMAVSALLTLVLGSSAPSQAPPESKLTAGDAAEADLFGTSVALSGDTVLVGAIGATAPDKEDTGAAYIFVRRGLGWIQQQKLIAVDGVKDDLFGAVALSGDTALVGAPYNTYHGKGGAVYAFVRRGSNFSLQEKLTADDFGGDFGTSVFLSGDIALIGDAGNYHAGRDSGAAYVFVRNGTRWTQQAKLTANDARAEQGFGYSVSLSGDTAIVGAYGDSDAGWGAGAAYVFVHSGTRWTQQAKLTASDAADFDHFGSSVALSGDTVLVGAHADDSFSGSAYVFVRHGTSWSQQQKLTSSAGPAGGSFGESLALDGDMAVVGASGDSDAASYSGSAYVFVRDGTRWTQQTRLTASDAGTEHGFGSSVALSGETALVGAPGDDHAGTVSGSAYVYELGPAPVRGFGAGCAGTLPAPVLQPAAGSTPRIGGTFDVVFSSLPWNNRAFLVLGLSNTRWVTTGLPMSLAPFGAPGCRLLVSGEFFSAVLNTGGTATQGFPIPPDPNLVGLHVYFQGAVEDPGANAFGMVVSNGLDITIGSR